MNYDEGRFPKKKIKCEILYSFPRIPPRKDRKITVTHDGGPPYIGHGHRSRPLIGIHDIVVYGGYEISLFQRGHSCVRKHPLRKYHDTIVGQPGAAGMVSHAFKRSFGFGVKP